MEIDTTTLRIDAALSNGEVCASMGMPISTTSNVCRFTLDFAKKVAEKVDLSLNISDFASCNPLNAGKEYRFLYGLNLPMDVFLENESWREEEGKYSIWKEDYSKEESKIWQLRNNERMVATEPQFVPRPGSDGEDDGVVLVPASCPADETSHLIVLDARSMEEIARVSCPVTINAGIHNLFVPAGNEYLLKF